MTQSILSFLTKKVLFSTSSALLAFGILTPTASYAATFVDTELYLAVDVSGSVDSSEFNLQKQGYVNAFLDQDIQNIIESSQNGIAAALGYWSNSQQTAVDFVLLKTAADATNFAALIDATARPFFGGTNIGPAINFAVNALATNEFDSAKQVIDVSGDGVSYSLTTRAARDAAVAQGITVNGLPIGSQYLVDFYQNNVQGGEDSFTVPANDFLAFDEAVKQKIFKEISESNPVSDSQDVPEPGVFLGLAGVGVAAFSTQKRKGDAPTS